MRRARAVLLPDACRQAQHGIEGWPTVKILENVPADTEAAGEARRAGVVPRANGRLRLVYVGTLEPAHRGLEDLMAAVAAQPQRLELWIAGTGPLAGLCAQMGQRYSHIRFVGEVRPDEALRMMGEGDIIVGMYYLTSRNHRYAAPNKYYEHLMLGRPLLTTQGTPPGQRVEEGATGWALAEGQAAITAWLEQLDVSEVAARGVRAARRWEAGYARYVTDVMEPQYLGCIARPSASGL